MQISTNVHRWPDDLLSKFVTGDLEEARTELRRLEVEGQEVIECGRHYCDDKGRCTGEPIIRLDREKMKHGG